MKISNSQQGFTMVELIITIAILSFGVLAVYEVFYPIITYTHAINLKFTATNLAQEGLEVARNMRDNNFIAGTAWSGGLLDCQAGCQLDYTTDASVQADASTLVAYDPNTFLRVNDDGLHGYGSGNATPFTREIVVSQVSTDILKVTANVYWSHNSQPYSFSVDQYLYNWY